MVRKYQMLLLVIILVLFMGSTSGRTENRPVQLSIFTPIQIFPEQDSITGVRLNLLYGRNSYVKGLDWGLVNHTTSGTTKAWQIGLVGFVESDFVGLQDNTVNIVRGNSKGVQFGIVNYSESAKGLQFGFFNYAETMYGIQIGLINVIRQDGFFPVFPIVNWSF